MIEPTRGRWISKPLKRRKTFLDVAWIWSLTIYPSAYLQHRYGESAPLILNVILATWVASFVVALVALPLRELRARTRNRRDLLFADRALESEEFAVEVVVTHADKVVGADRGVAWFENGLLGFTGELTSFLLAYKDLMPKARWTLTEIDRSFVPLRLRLGGGRTKVSVRPMWGQGRRYRRGMRRFLREKAVTTALRQWPPILAYEPPPEQSEASSNGSRTEVRR